MNLRLVLIFRLSAAFCTLLVYLTTLASGQIDWDDDDDPGVRKNKWWWSIFTWLVDVSIQNAWLLRRKSNSNITHLQFRRSIAQHYCNTVSLAQSFQKHVIPENDRYDQTNHFPVKTTKRRCQLPTCNSRSRVKCEKCDVGLCIDPCFKKYHIPQ